MMTSAMSTSPTVEIPEPLARLGFTPAAGGSYERDALCLAIGPHWCVLEAQARSALVPGRAPTAALGAPGLWKLVGAEPRLLFALPRRVWDEAASAEASFDADITVLEHCLLWALDTAQGDVASEWQPPARAVVESWFKPELLTVVAGSLLRQGEVICEPDRFAIRFPLLPELPPHLPASRLAWLCSLLNEAQERWHLVRLGIVTDDDGLTSVVAEVDLTGVPREIAEDLFAVSLEALRWVVQWLGETTDWLADATVASELLAVCPDQQP